MKKCNCQDCICLVEGTCGEWICDEVNKKIEDIEVCPEGMFGINMVVIDDTDTFVEYEWETVGEFIDDILNQKDTAPRFTDILFTVDTPCVSCNEDDLRAVGIVTVEDFMKVDMEE